MAAHRFNRGFTARFRIHNEATVNLFIWQLYLACKQDNQYRKHNYKKGVVSLIRNTLVSLNPEWVVTLNRNQVVSFSEISTLLSVLIIDDFPEPHSPNNPIVKG